MKIAIIGSGRIGAGLGRAWAAKDHEIVFGVRDPKSADLEALGSLARVRLASVAEAPVGADVVVLAVPYGALTEVLEELGPLEGQLVIDCTNAVKRGMTLEHGHTTSAAELLQARIPKARVFKSFNAQGAENIASPTYGDRTASNFFCGDDAAGRAVMKALIEDVGFDAVDAGPLENARLLEPMMVLWVTTSQALGTRDLAFTLMRR